MEAAPVNISTWDRGTSADCANCQGRLWKIQSNARIWYHWRGQMDSYDVKCRSAR